MNEVQAFLLEEIGIRGALVRLNETWTQIVAQHVYSPAVLEVLGHGIAATVLLASGLKGKPKVSLQLQGEGPLSLLVVQCSRELRVRGMAQWREPSAQEALLGAGRLAVMLDTADVRGVFQGIVPLSGPTLDQCLEAYFEQSEQLPTRIVLLAAESTVAGLLVQALPDHSSDTETFSTVARQLDSVDPADIKTAAAESLLPRLFPNDAIRLFKARPVLHDCRCTPEHLAGIARMLGRTELEDILAEQGRVELTCEFCNRVFSYDPQDVELILGGDTPSVSTH